MDHSTVFSFTVLQLTLLVMIVGVVFWGVADWNRHRQMLPQLEQERAFRLQSEKARMEESDAAKAAQDLASQRLADAATRQASLEKSLAETQDRLTREVGQAMTKISELDLDLKTAQQQTRELETALTASKSRVTDLEASLESEKGRIAAMQEALEAKQDLAKQLAQELSSARTSFADERKTATEREAALRAQLANHEKLAASGQSMTDVVNAELEKTRAAQAELEKESASRLAELQKKLSAADQKSAMLQKEIMALVNSTGNTAEAAAAVTAAEELDQAKERALQAEKKIAELEAQLSQGDAGTRKRLREAEYKICELEFKLAQVDEGQTPPAV